MNQDLIKINKLSLNIGKKKVLDSINLKIKQGESILIAGSNGAGKTTFIKCLAGVIFPDRGTIEYTGGLTKEKIGFISDQVSLFENWNLKQGIEFHKYIFKIQDFDLSLIEKLKLNLNSKIKNLSAGERVLYHLSLLLAQKPDLLLIDEIIHTIDPYLRDHFLEAVIGLMDECRSTVIMINHTFSEVEKIPERLLVMEEGKFILDEPSETLRHRVKKIISKEEIASDLPCIFSKETDFGSEYFIYPFDEKLRSSFDYEFLDLSLNEIMKAFIGGHYVEKRI